PVTEAVTGLDLVEWQLRVASGEPLPLRQDEIGRSGWAMEARLYAEDPANGFLPSVGPLAHFVLPAGVRIDSGVEAGGRVAAEYDPMIAKLVAHGPTREAAARRLADACAAVEVWPVKTNAGFLARALGDPDFVAGRIDTGFFEARMEALTQPPPPSVHALAAAARALAPTRDGSPWTDPGLSGLRLGAPPARALVQQGEALFEADPRRPSEGAVIRDGEAAVVFEAGEALVFSRPHGEDEDAAHGGDGRILAPMPGRIVAVAVAVGEKVARGQKLVALEAMKMEHALVAPFDGVLVELRCEIGDQTVEGQLLARLEAEA
ncbi:MAG: biotin/lipoyl-containing protein, partial [Caulobacteraceae bacterium]